MSGYGRGYTCIRLGACSVLFGATVICLISLVLSSARPFGDGEMTLCSNT